MLQISKIALWLSVFCHVGIYGTWTTDNGLRGSYKVKKERLLQKSPFLPSDFTTHTKCELRCLESFVSKSLRIFRQTLSC